MSPRPPLSATGRRACPWWPRRSGDTSCTDSAAQLGYARVCSPAPPGLWLGSPDCGRIGSAGSSVASPGRVLALPSKSRPEGCPRDPLFSNHEPLTTVNCGGTAEEGAPSQYSFLTPPSQPGSP